MPGLINLIGQRFGRLTVLERGHNKGKKVRWICRCECGVTKEIMGYSLQSGKAKSCRCLRIERLYRFAKARKCTDPQILAERKIRKLAGDRRRELSRIYKLSPEQLIELQKQQGNRCAICEISKATHIDHCHISNVVRGLLCRNCNWMLGHAKDSVTVLQSAITYLLKFQ